MRTLLIGNGYWGSIIREKLETQTQLVYIANSKDDIDEVLKKYDVDYVFVCTPTETHYDIVKKCIAHRKNIFCEKPFTGDFFKANELYDLSEKNGVKLFVDNIFLYRTEFIEIKKNKFNNVKFIWNKYEEFFKENLFYTLLYHDLYLLIEMFDVNWEVLNCNVSEDKLSISLSLDNVKSEFLYNRNCYGVKEKKIILDDITVDFSFPKNDALYGIISSLKENLINFQKNKQITLKTIKLLNEIKNECLLYTSRNLN